MFMEGTCAQPTTVVGLLPTLCKPRAWNLLVKTEILEPVSVAFAAWAPRVSKVVLRSEFGLADDGVQCPLLARPMICKYS